LKRQRLNRGKRAAGLLRTILGLGPLVPTQFGKKVLAQHDRGAVSGQLGALPKRLGALFTLFFAGDYSKRTRSRRDLQASRRFQNPYFVEVTIQSYRHRYGNAAGDPALEPIERLLEEKSLSLVFLRSC
jgi:hypothetical protein